MKTFSYQKAILLAIVASSAGALQLAQGQGYPTETPSTAPGATATPTGTAAPQGAVTVNISQGATGKGPAAYGTNPLVISAGTTVTWVNEDSAPHTATSDTGVFDSGTLTTGQRFSHQFNEPGTYPYYCTIHGKQSMSGTIQVQ